MEPGSNRNGAARSDALDTLRSGSARKPVVLTKGGESWAGQISLYR